MPPAGKSLEWYEGGPGGDAAAATEEGGIGRLVASIPLAAISQAAHPGKGEVDIQLMDEDTVERDDEVLVEMRLYVPPSHVLPDASAAADAAKRRASVKADKAGAVEGARVFWRGAARRVAAAASPKTAPEAAPRACA